tara:strand:+ start:140 stop:445 length:306 start_codon:yes stop_codon:yes gene_type:complete
VVTPEKALNMGGRKKIAISENALKAGNSNLKALVVPDLNYFIDRKNSSIDKAFELLLPSYKSDQVKEWFFTQTGVQMRSALVTPKGTQGRFTKPSVFNLTK